MELTLRTPAALEALARILREVPEMLAGVGAVLTPEQVREVKSAGAAFAVAPGMNQAVVRAVADHRRPERADRPRVIAARYDERRLLVPSRTQFASRTGLDVPIAGASGLE